jgi:hypothetical protein
MIAINEIIIIIIIIIVIICTFLSAKLNEDL